MPLLIFGEETVPSISTEDDGKEVAGASKLSDIDVTKG